MIQSTNMILCLLFSDLKSSRDDALFISAGTLFHKMGAAALNTPSPYNLNRDTDTCNSIWMDDLSFRDDFLMDPNSHKYSGEWPGRHRGLAVAWWTTNHYHPCANLGVGISEGCFIFDFASLPLEIARPHLAYHVHKTGRKTSIIIIWLDNLSFKDDFLIDTNSNRYSCAISLIDL